MNFPPSISKFPITEHLEEICSTLKASPSRALVLTAETGAGKSTVLPLALLQAFAGGEGGTGTGNAATSPATASAPSAPGKIIMTEPRRLAVVGVANRVSELLGEQTGATVGYRIHLENRVSPQTRLEVMTEAILIRMLQSDPTLEGVNLVVLDEFHERSVNTDLALAFLREAMELRDDLFVIIMSATIESKKIADFLGGAPILEIPGRTFPVDIIYDDKLSCESVVLGQLQRINHNSAGSAPGQTAKDDPSSILVFLPGISEIRKVQANLAAELAGRTDVELCVLHSSISFSEQKHILTPPPAGITRVILSSAIAETSLTVPGVSVVIDSGLSRVNRINLSTGMENLVTENESEFSAAQRAGRAGREGPGKCIRLWNKFDVRAKTLQPEILRTDLTQLVLECCDRGIYDLSKIVWLDSPQPNAWKSAAELLKSLGCIDDKNHILPRGKAALQLGISVRLACIGIDGMTGFDKNNSSKSPVLAKNAAEFLIKYAQYSQSPANIQSQFLRNFEQKFSKICQNFTDFQKIRSNSADFNQKNSPILLLSGFPDRIALRLSEMKKSPDGTPIPEYQFPSGRKAVIHNSKHTSSKWILAPEVMAGQTEGVIFDFEEVDTEAAENWLYAHASTSQTCRFENGKIIKTENLAYGEIILSSKKLPSSKEDYAQAWLTEIRSKGLSALPQEAKITSFLERLSFLAQQNPDDTELSQKIAELTDSPEKWLLPFITGINLTAEMVYNALTWYFTDQSIDTAVPTQITLQNGNRAKVKYESLASPEDKTKLVLRPVIEIIIQRAFGVTVTPKIAGMKVLFRLLSPAQRPLQITDDLENFWSSTWPQICKEMKGRYPKHNWDLSKIEEPLKNKP